MAATVIIEVSPKDLGRNFAASGYPKSSNPYRDSNQAKERKEFFAGYNSAVKKS